MDWCGGISLRLDCTENGLSLCLTFSCRSCALFTESQDQQVQYSVKKKH